MKPPQRNLQPEKMKQNQEQSRESGKLQRQLHLFHDLQVLVELLVSPIRGAAFPSAPLGTWNKNIHKFIGAFPIVVIVEPTSLDTN